jgi:hypothetical protein
MNLESNSSKKPNMIVATDDIDFDFKPITSGLGFHNTQTTEIKPNFNQTPSVSLHQVSVPMPVSKPAPMARKENQIYQNELSAFYGRDIATNTPVEIPKEEKVIRNATKSQRVLAYILDLGLVLSCVALVLTVMSRLIEKDLMEVWTTYPNEITPLVVVLFTGFYVMYFSIFEKTAQSTLGKNLLSITVVDLDNKSQSFTMLMFRSLVTLMNFVSLGLFSYFDLQNKIANTKVIKVD